MESEDTMTEQEKKELLDELEKRMDEKYKGCPGYNTLSLMPRGSEVNE